MNIQQAINNRGQKTHGYIPVGDRADGSPIRLAVSVVSGIGDGPVLAVDAGIHGDEMEGIEAVIQVVKMLDPAQLSGTLIAVPALNTLGFEAGMRFAFSDQKYTAYTSPDMNRIYPGNDEGSITERLADLHFRNVIELADYVISFHGGGNKGIIGPFVACQDYEGHVGVEAMRMARAFGLEIIWKVSAWRGILSTESSLLGKPAILPEVGGDASRYPERDFLPISIEGILNVMRELGMLKEEVKRPPSYQNVGLEYLKANQGGIFLFHTKLGDTVERGDLIGETLNLSGETVENVRAPWSGRICGIRTYPLVHMGDWIFMLSRGIHASALLPKHEELGAKVSMTMGWEQIMNYGSLEEEYWAVRRDGAGLTDLSSMGKLLVEGSGSEKLLDYLFVNDIGNLQVGHVCYTSLCGADGRMLDDDTVYKYSPEKHLVVTSTTTREETEQWLADWAEKLKIDVSVKNLTQDYCLLALQGPSSVEILKKAISPGVAKLQYFDFAEFTFEGETLMISRTGFTGELGFEIYIPNNAALRLWDLIMGVGNPLGMKPVGLGAVLTLRLEKGYALWGREIDKTTNPLEAGLGWTIKLDKNDFLAKKALAAVARSGPNRRLTGFVMKDVHVVPAAGSPIVIEGRMVGQITSASYSYQLEKSIGLGYVEADYRQCTGQVEIHSGGVRHRADFAALPFYDPKGAKLKTLP